MSINRVELSGNITRDAELHGAMCAFTIAVNDRERGEDGEWKDAPSFVDCKVLGQRAAKLVGYLSKGTKVAIAGRIKQDKWQAKDGTNRSALRVIVDDLEFMSRAESRPAPKPTQDAYADEEIPF